VAALIGDVARRPRADQALRFGLSAFVIARPTDEEAQAEFQRLLALAAKDAAIRAIQKSNTDPAVVMKQTMAQTRGVGTNGGTAAGLVGSYETVADRIAAFHASGVELFMLQFQPFEAEMRRFAQQIMPRVHHRLQPEASRSVLV
jgi:alkanesulfonate monooxygenase